MQVMMLCVAWVAGMASGVGLVCAWQWNARRVHAARQVHAGTAEVRRLRHETVAEARRSTHTDTALRVATAAATSSAVAAARRVTIAT